MSISPNSLIANAPFFQVIETLYAVSASGPTQICKANPTRVSIAIGSGQSASYSLSTLPSLATNKGCLVTTSQAFTLMDYASYGAMVQREWYVLGSATQNITVIETFFRQDVETDVSGDGL